MKLILLITAPIAVALAATGAQAQDRVVKTTTVTRHVDSGVHHDEGARPNHGARWKRVCTNRWVHHKKIRSCKNVRVRW